MAGTHFYELLTLAPFLAVAGYLAWRLSGHFNHWSLSKPGLRWSAVLFLASAFVCAGLAQHINDDRRPIRVLDGTITEVNRDHGKFGLPKDSGSFSVLGDPPEAVTLSTEHWDQFVGQGQRVRVFYQERKPLFGKHTLGLLDHADFLSSNNAVTYSLNNADDLHRLINPWFIVAGLLIWFALPLPRRDGTTGGINSDEFK